MALRRALAEAGWRVHGWEHGLEPAAPRADTIERLRQRLDEIDRRAAGPGRRLEPRRVFARELARACPDRVRAVVTLGSPVLAAIRKQNNVWRLYEWVAGHKVDEPPIPRITDKPPVPTWPSGRGETGSSPRAPPAASTHERDKEVELDCTPHGVRRVAPHGRDRWCAKSTAS